MATINDPLLNGMRGKLGKYVFMQLNGKTVVRSLPFTVKNALIPSDEGWQINPPALKHSNGSLLNAENYSVTNPDALNILISWRDNSGISNALPTDTFCYIVYNITQNKVFYNLTPIKRSEESYSFNLPDNWSGCDIAFYGFFKGTDKYSISNDSYLGTLNLKPL